MRSKNMTKDIKFSCNFHMFFFLFKTHADISLIEFKKPHFPSSETQGQIVGRRRKSKRAGKNSTSKSTKEKYEPLGTNSLRTSSKRPNEYSLLIGQKSFLPNQEQVKSPFLY